ncbi:hypothetical protein PUN28_003797 [Cardiocondyla obscurior]|uniref:Secreted protein n=1 Tax=Cardiocondyla obscurior TaxID=286306 RepID=A0AAW2GM36_9HYME
MSWVIEIILIIRLLATRRIRHLELTWNHRVLQSRCTAAAEVRERSSSENPPTYHYHYSRSLADDASSKSNPGIYSKRSLHPGSR